MSRDTTDIANELLAENAALKAQLSQRDAQIAALQENLNSCLITVAKYSGPDNTGNIDNTAQQYEALAGWKLVPIEPTEEMLSQIHPVADGNCRHCGNSTTLDCEENMLLSWRDMLEAAPKPEV